MSIWRSTIWNITKLVLGNFFFYPNLFFTGEGGFILFVLLDYSCCFSVNSVHQCQLSVYQAAYLYLQYVNIQLNIQNFILLVSFSSYSFCVYRIKFSRSLITYPSQWNSVPLRKKIKVRLHSIFNQFNIFVYNQYLLNLSNFKKMLNMK